jgi:hypothetical protein
VDAVILEQQGTFTPIARARPSLDAVLLDLITAAGDCGITEGRIVEAFEPYRLHAERMRTVLARLAVAGEISRDGQSWVAGKRSPPVAPPVASGAVAVRDHKLRQSASQAGSRCVMCDQHRPASAFPVIDGVVSRSCRACRDDEPTKHRHQASAAVRNCPCCRAEKPESEFSRNPQVPNCATCLAAFGRKPRAASAVAAEAARIRSQTDRRLEQLAAAVPPETKLFRCEACTEDLPEIEFQRLRNGRRTNACRTCHGAAVAKGLPAVQVATGPDRRCPGCACVKPAAEFYLTSNTARCKSCCREYQRAYDERRRARKSASRPTRTTHEDHA